MQLVYFRSLNSYRFYTNFVTGEPGASSLYRFLYKPLSRMSSLVRDCAKESAKNDTSNEYEWSSVLSPAIAIMEKAEEELEKENTRILQKRYEFMEDQKTEESGEHGKRITPQSISRQSSPFLHDVPKIFSESLQVNKVRDIGQSPDDAETQFRQVLQNELAFQILRVSCFLAGLQVAQTQHRRNLLPLLKKEFRTRKRMLIQKTILLSRMLCMRIWHSIIKALSRITRSRIQLGYRRIE